MKTFTRHLAALAGIVLLAAASLSVPAAAQTVNIPISTPGVVLIPVHLDGQFTATTSAAVTIKLPFRAKVLGVSASARASGGTAPTLTVDVLDDAASILTAPVAVTAGTVTEAALDAAAAQIADESIVTIDLAITGTSPTWDDIDVLITVARN